MLKISCLVSLAMYAMALALLGGAAAWAAAATATEPGGALAWVTADALPPLPYTFLGCAAFFL